MARALERMMIERTWRPSSRKGVSLRDQICFSDTIWPGGAETAIFDHVTSAIGILYAGSDCATAEMSLKLKRAVAPIPGLMKAEAWVDRVS